MVECTYPPKNSTGAWIRGSARPHAGFGPGFERMVQFVTRHGYIRDDRISRYPKALPFNIFYQSVPGPAVKPPAFLLHAGFYNFFLFCLFAYISKPSYTPPPLSFHPFPASILTGRFRKALRDYIQTIKHENVKFTVNISAALLVLAYFFSPGSALEEAVFVGFFHYNRGISPACFPCSDSRRIRQDNWWSWSSLVPLSARSSSTRMLPAIRNDKYYRPAPFHPRHRFGAGMILVYFK